MIYGFSSINDYNLYIENGNYDISYLNPNYSYLRAYDSNISAECLTINNSMNSILIPEITIINDYTFASYPLVVRNEGKYDAYLDTSWLTEEDRSLSEFYYGTCTAEPETQQSLVDLACQNVVTKLNVKITAGNEYNQQE